MPLCNLKSEELECRAFFPTVKDPHTKTKYCVPSGQIPRRHVVHASLFRFGQIMTNISRTEKRWEDKTAIVRSQ